MAVTMGRQVETISSMSEATLKVSFVISMLLASILDRSSTSVTSESKCLPAALMRSQIPSRCPLAPDDLGVFEQHFAIADHGVERRAELVAHLGQENRLAAIGRVRQLLGSDEPNRGRRVSFTLALEFGAHRNDVGVEYRHPRHIDDRRKYRDPTDGRQLRRGHQLLNPKQEIGEGESADVPHEQAHHHQRPISQVEEAQQQS